MVHSRRLRRDPMETWLRGILAWRGPHGRLAQRGAAAVVITTLLANSLLPTVSLAQVGPTQPTPTATVGATPTKAATEVAPAIAPSATSVPIVATATTVPSAPQPPLPVAPSPIPSPLPSPTAVTAANPAVGIPELDVAGGNLDLLRFGTLEVPAGALPA